MAEKSKSNGLPAEALCEALDCLGGQLVELLPGSSGVPGLAVVAIKRLIAERDRAIHEIAVYLDVLDNAPDESSTSELRQLLERSGYELPED